MTTIHHPTRYANLPPNLPQISHENHHQLCPVSMEKKTPQLSQMSGPLLAHLIYLFNHHPSNKLQPLKRLPTTFFPETQARPQHFRPNRLIHFQGHHEPLPAFRRGMTHVL
jgi:hypothetical protein